jgi:hypothetical protein
MSQSAAYYGLIPKTLKNFNRKDAKSDKEQKHNQNCCSPAFPSAFFAPLRSIPSLFSQNRAQKKADPGKVGFEWSWWKALWVVGERTFHIGGRMALLIPLLRAFIQFSIRLPPHATSSISHAQ